MYIHMYVYTESVSKYINNNSLVFVCYYIFNFQNLSGETSDSLEKIQK